MICHATRPACLLAAALLFGCETPGERALSGECPEDETCSDDTPEGLYFQGAPLAGLGRNVNTIAVGGTQTVTVLERDGDSFRRFVASFEASADEPILVSGLGGADLSVSADAAGSGYLRISDRDSGDLFDRVLVRAAEIERVELVSTEYEDGAYLYAEGAPTLVVRLYGTDDERLVDEGIEIAASEPVEIDHTYWDLVTVADLEPGELELSVITSAGDELPFTFDVTDSIDVIEPMFDSNTHDPDDPLEVGAQAIMCFEGTYDDRPVAGLGWSFDAEGPVELIPEPLGARHCVVVEATDVGEAILTAAAADLDYELELEIVEAATARLFEPVPLLEESAPTAGARARR